MQNFLALDQVDVGITIVIDAHGGKSSVFRFRHCAGVAGWRSVQQFSLGASQAGLLQAGGAFGNGGDTPVADIHQTKLAHQPDEVVQFGSGAGHFEDEGAERGIDHAGLEDIGDAQALDPAVASPGDLDQRQFALDMRAFTSVRSRPGGPGPAGRAGS